MSISRNFSSIPGQMPTRIQNFDWALTPLGAIVNWDQTLKIMVDTLLRSPFPKFLIWKSNRTVIYNDAFIPILGDQKHPGALGQDLKEVFGETWASIEPMIEVGYTGQSSYFENRAFPLTRQGRTEESYFTFSYSPVLDDEARITGLLCACVETTQTVLAMREVQRAKLDLSDALESTTDAFFAVDKNWIITSLNRNHEIFTEKKREDQLGKSLLDLFFSTEEAKQTKFVMSYRKVMTERVSVEFTEYYPALDLWSRVRAFPRADGGMVVFFGNVNEQKRNEIEAERARKDLEFEQQKLRAVVDNSSASIAVLRGEKFVYEIANRSYAELFSNRELIGRPLLEALPELATQAFPIHAKSVFQTGVPYVEREARAFLKRTEFSPIEERFFDQTYSQILDRVGEPYGIFMHAQEVTDRVRARREIEQAAERFRIALEIANMGTWEFDSETGLVQFTKRAAELFDVDQLENLAFDDVQKRIHPDDLAKVNEAIEAALKPTGPGNYAVDYRIVHRSGQIRWISDLGKVFFADTPSGKTAERFTGNILDITDRVLAEVALRDAKERAELASAAKSTFLANMSHEIRTPLGAIMGFVSLIKDEGLTPQMLLEYVSVIERNSSQLMRIIDDILDLSKVEAGMMQIEHIDFSLIELLSDFASLMGFRAREKGVVFEMRAKTELPSIINSDPTRLRQILMNIVGNAIKFTERGLVQLFISFGSDTLEFEVTDTGRGIDLQQIADLFQPFAQGDISTTRKYGGTGLGLVLTRRLSEAMGGNFALKESALGRGSTFSSTIKVKVPENVQLVRALGFASEPIRNAGYQAVLQNLNVLLVEDSPDNQSLFSIYLTRAGARIDIASDGAQGVDMALAGRYDVVLMDVQMPIMDGITAVKRLRAEGYAAPIIALTAHAMVEERKRCLEAGYTKFLSKPVQRGDLVEALTEYVSRSEQ